MATQFPQDKDKYLSTDNVIRQTECQYKFGKTAAEFNIRFMGDTGEVTQLASTYRQDTIVKTNTLTSDFDELSAVDISKLEGTGKVMVSTATTRKGCATANIVINIPYNSKLKYPDGDEPSATKIVTWSEKTTKWQFPLEVYAGNVSSDSTDYACAGDYSAWLNENGTNADNYKNFKYSLTDSSTVSLSARTLDLAKKRYAGIESVERGYPEVIRTTVYSNIEGDEGESDASVVRKIDESPNLYQIDSTPNSVWQSKFSDFSWLKSAYDVEFSETEYEGYWNATVTESWIGINEKERGAWDKNLYGLSADRWNFYTKDLSA